jgi:tetratricopeptide (TPR) repeat protein
MRRPATKFKPASAGKSAAFPNYHTTLPWLLALFLAFLTIVLYWPAVSCNFINYDDDVYVTSNAHVQHGLTLDNIKWAFINPVDANWHPVTMLSHMLACQIFGLNPAGHHLINMLLHAANTILVFLLLQYLTNAPWRSALVAAFFGLHPLHVESVAWVTERKDVLSTFFGLLSLIFYARYAKAESEKQKAESNGFFPSSIRHPLFSLAYCLSFGCLALGLMSKPMLVTWPFVFLLLDYWPLERFNRASFGQMLIEKIPFFVPAAVVGVATFIVQNQNAVVATVGRLSIGARCENALISYCRYLGKLIWPADLAVFYPHPHHWPLPEVLGAGAALAGISVIAWLMRRRSPFVLMGWLWFLGTLVPVIGLVQAGQQAMADRYAYFPSLGFLIIVIWGACEFARQRRDLAMALSVAGVIALIICFGVTRLQLGYWRDSETLMRHALEVTRNNYVAYNNLGAALNSRGMVDEAISQFQKAIQANQNYSGSFDNLGAAYYKKGELDEAILQFQEAIRLNPNDSGAHNNFGNALLAKGQLDEAILQFREAIRLEPDDAQAHYNLANTLDKKGEFDEAIVQYQKALVLNPYFTDAYDNLGNVYNKAGRLDDAIGQFQEAIRIEPKDAGSYNNLGNVLQAKGRLDEAMNQFQEAIRLNPNFAEAHNNLGNTLFARGRTDEAIQQYQDAVQLNPDYAQAYNNLGAALGSVGRIEEAITQFQEAVRLNPQDPEARNNLNRALEIKNSSTSH